MNEIIDENVLKIICKKVSKNSSGDIRSMLEVATEIFESKKRNTKDLYIEKSLKSDEFCIGNENYDMGKYKINMTDAIIVLNGKFDDKIKVIVRSLSLNLQVSLLALYFSLKENEEGCDYVTNFFIHIKTEKIPDKIHRNY